MVGIARKVGVGALAVGVATVAFLLVRHGPIDDVSPVAAARASWAQVEASSLSPERKLARYREIVETLQDNKDSQVQEEVAAVRMRMGYLTASTTSFEAARQVFLETETEYAGTGAIEPSFGTLPDQAAYQAAVCLVADGKIDEASEEFRRFIQERPLSPLVHASHRRLMRLAPEGAVDHNRLLQAAVTQQEENMRFEASVCGPKVIEELLRRSNQPTKSYTEIAELCGTTEEGTTLEGMRQGLKALGHESWGYRVNRKDFARLPLPAIYLGQDHYVLLLYIAPLKAIVYDPIYRSQRAVDLPPLDDLDFTATVLTLKIPRFMENR
jgi:hypothetical protein